MSGENQITVCGASVRHHFKDMRAKSKQSGPPYHFFMRCVRCTAMLHQVVSTRTTKEGDVVPVAKAYLITASGSTEVQSQVRPAAVDAGDAAETPP